MRKTDIKIQPKMVNGFKDYLQERENAPATIEKYIRDVRTFLRYVDMVQEDKIKKDILLDYKSWLLQHYSISSVNSMIVALNQFLIYLELGRLRLKRVRVQRQDMENMEKELTKEEFQKLVRDARKLGKDQLAMIMETMCATGIRVSELKFFRVETMRTGVVKVWNKGKYRLVIIPKELQMRLLLYIRKNGLSHGPIFCTKSGKEKDRSNIWKEMKKLAKEAGINTDKVFPHNLRHLFARTFYKTTKNLINLADILGHSNLEVTRSYASDGIKEWKRNLERMRILEV